MCKRHRKAPFQSGALFSKRPRKTQKVAQKTRKKVDILGLITNQLCYTNITEGYSMGGVLA
jgi:hypothetical protein